MSYPGEFDFDRSQIRVLHVDDQQEFLDVAAEFLRRETDTIEVVTETSARNACERLDGGQFDCIVSDYDMPGQDGLEFLEQVRAEYPDLPFILFTGKGSEEIASEAISAGVTDYLEKRAGAEQYAVLANRIENAVDQARSRDALEASQERLSSFIEQSPLGVIEWDDNFDIAGVNEATEDILGYRAEELRGCSWERIVPDSDRDTVSETVAELLEAEGGYHNINENVRKDDERIICEWHNRVVTDDAGDTVAILSQFQDVTERKEHEERLRKTSARLRALFENSPVMINVHDGAGNIVDVNPPLCETTGYTEAELTAMKVWDLDRMIGPEQAYALWEGMAVGDRRQLEGVYQRQDGSTFPVEVHVRRLALDGEDRFLVISQDMTGRKERERELESYEAIVENTEDGIYVFDDESRFEFVNQRVVDVSGIPREGWVGEHVSIQTDLGTLTREEVAEVEAGIESIVESDRNEVRIELAPDVPEAIETLELRLASLRTGDGQTRVIGYTRDISDRKSHESKLENLQQRTQVLMSTGTLEETAQVAVDAAREVLDAPLSGFHQLSADGQHLELVTAADGLDTAFDTLPAYDRTDDSDSVGAVIWEAFDAGEKRIIDDTSSHPRLADNTPAGSGIIYPVADQGVFIVSATEPDSFDETDKRLIELLATTLTTALQRVSRESVLEDRERELTRQNNRLEEFVSIVSHDLRNPLNVASGRLDLLARECDSEHLDHVERAHDRMEVLIEDLLTLAMEGNSVTEPEPVDFATLVEGSWETVETADATLVTDLDREIQVDESRIKQMFENLFRNAVEHGCEGVTVTVGELSDGFFLEDDGPGITEGDHDRIFEAGYSGSPEGTGFGLSIVEEIVDAHGWEIRAATGTNGGVRFEITGVGS
ncbi:MAG: PAS domain S-box protein [Halovenus sp.]